MAELENQDQLISFGAAPHQRQFAREFLASNSPRSHVLVAPAGSGKSQMAVRLIQTQQNRGARHILLFTSRHEIAAQYVYRLRNMLQIPVVLLDRRYYRELQEQVRVDVNPFEAQMAIVISGPLEDDDDISDDLLGIRWDFVCVDAATHGAESDNSRLIARLVQHDNFDRLLYMVSDRTDRIAASIPELKVTEWSWEQLRLASPRLTRLEEFPWQRLGYTRSEGEQALLAQLTRLIQSRFAVPSLQGYGLKLLSAAASSQFALDIELRAVYSELCEGDSARPLATHTGTELRLSNLLSPKERPTFAADVLKLIDALDHLTDDVKLDTLAAKVSAAVTAQPSARLCIYSMNSRTVTYLRSRLIRSEEQVYQLTDQTPAEEIATTLEQFKSTRGILVTSMTALLESNLGTLGAVIHYDLPNSPDEMQRRVQQAQRAQAHFVLHDASRALPLEIELEKMHGIMAQ